MTLPADERELIAAARRDSLLREFDAVTAEIELSIERLARLLVARRQVVAGLQALADVEREPDGDSGQEEVSDDGSTG